jgi:hypothetical protein
MTHKTAIVCSLVAGLLGVRPLVGQGCGVAMTKNYSVYGTASADSSHIYTSVVTDGSASCTPSLSCPCNSATHTPKSYNKIGTTGGWGTGTPQCVNCYWSYTNNQSIVATAGVPYPFQANGEVDCSLVGAFFAASLGPGITEAEHPNCGSGNGQTITIFTPPLSQTCNGTTAYTAEMSVEGTGVSHLAEVFASTTTDAGLILELLGSPSLNTNCPNTAGHEWCLNQSYKAHKLAPYKGNIKWYLKIYCGGISGAPDIEGNVYQAFQCL